MPKKSRRPPPNRRTSASVPEPIFDWEAIAGRAVDRIMSAPKVQELGAKAGGILDMVQGFLQTGAAPGAPPPQAPPPRSAPTEDPRIVMGFGPAEPLTVEKVKTRKKALASILHSDKAGGSPEGMVRLNRAADQLLKELRR